MSTLANIRPLVRSIARTLVRNVASAFTPSQLFGEDTAGAWYDPSDLRTLYQDAVGTLPVTAAGQPVGLMLDKSQGLTRGPDVVVNGGFDVDSSWNKVGGWQINNGVASRAPTGTIDILSQACLTAGRTYEFEVDLTVTAGAINIWLGGVRLVDSRRTSGRITGIITARSNNRIELQALETFAGSLDNIVAREVPGAHMTQATATARPRYRTGPARLDFDGVDDNLSASFTAPLGVACTVAAAHPVTGVDVSSDQTVGSTFSVTEDTCGLVITNRALTETETASLTAWLSAKVAS